MYYIIIFIDEPLGCKKTTTFKRNVYGSLHNVYFLIYKSPNENSSFGTKTP
jgi:hypothetical protein